MRGSTVVNSADLEETFVKKKVLYRAAKTNEMVGMGSQDLSLIPKRSMPVHTI